MKFASSQCAPGTCGPLDSIGLGFISWQCAPPTNSRCLRERINHTAIRTASASEGLAAEFLNWRRQPNDRCDGNQWRLDSAQAASPLTSISTIPDMSSSLLRLRRREQTIHVNVSKTFQLY